LVYAQDGKYTHAALAAMLTEWHRLLAIAGTILRPSVNGGASLTGNGVTLVFTSSSGHNYASARISGNATIDLTAPTSGPTCDSDENAALTTSSMRQSVYLSGHRR
jgi:hypothetical protein